MHEQLGRFESRTLAGTPMAVPDDLTRPTLIFFAYRQQQQVEVDSWIRALDGDDRVAVLEVPVLSSRWRPARGVIDGGMASNMDEATRAATMCVYTDVRAFQRRVIGLRGKAMRAVLVDADGGVHWHAAGPATPAAFAELVLVIEHLNASV